MDSNLSQVHDVFWRIIAYFSHFLGEMHVFRLHKYEYQVTSEIPLETLTSTKNKIVIWLHVGVLLGKDNLTKLNRYVRRKCCVCDEKGIIQHLFFHVFLLALCGE
jgi:hypothetical protein